MVSEEGKEAEGRREQDPGLSVEFISVYQCQVDCSGVRCSL